MLYPIELLRRRAGNERCTTEDGVHVNQHTGICHVIHGAFCLSTFADVNRESCILQQGSRPSLQNA